MPGGAPSPDPFCCLDADTDLGVVAGLPCLNVVCLGGGGRPTGSCTCQQCADLYGFPQGIIFSFSYFFVSFPPPE